jgi:hypothetical protein
MKNKIKNPQNQPRCPKIDEWIKKLAHNLYMYTMENYSAIKENEMGVRHSGLHLLS